MGFKMEEIAAVFQHERQRWDETLLGRVQLAPEDGSRGRCIDIKGPAQPDELTPQLTYRFYGRWYEHPKWGRQFHFSTFVRAQPHTMCGVIRYLQLGPGVGPGIAQQLWDKFGSDAVRILRTTPEVASAAVPRLTEDTARDAAKWLEHERALEACHIDLIELLDKRGFPKATARAAIQRWGNRAARLIKRNPYLLMRFRGCGFARCDQLYLELGFDPTRLKRQAYSAWYALARNTDGHTWQPVQHVIRGIKERVAGAEIKPDAAIALAQRGRLLATRRDEQGQLWCAESRRAVAEEKVACLVAAAVAESVPPAESEVCDAMA